MRFPPFSEDAGRPLWTSVDSFEDAERTVRTWMKKQIVEFFLDGFRNLVHRCRIVCGEWRLLCGEGRAGDKRAHFKNFFHISSIKISVFKQKSRWRHYFLFTLRTKLYCTLTNKTDLYFVVLHTPVATHEMKLDYVIKWSSEQAGIGPAVFESCGCL
jgi:hypothetical protein